MPAVCSRETAELPEVVFFAAVVPVFRRTEELLFSFAAAAEVTFTYCMKVRRPSQPYGFSSFCVAVISVSSMFL